MPTRDEFLSAKAFLRNIEAVERMGAKLNDEALKLKLDMEIVVMEYKLELKRTERASFD